MIMTERECTLLALEHKDTPWVPAVDTGQDSCIPTVLEEGARGYRISTDWFGVKYILRPDQPGPMPVESEPLIEEIEDWKDIVKFPNLDEYDWEGCAARDTAKWDRKNKVSNIILINGMFESLHMFCGVENALCNIITDEEASSDFMSAIADYKIEVIRRVKKYYNADKIQFHDDYANNAALFMDIPRWQRIIKPHLKRVIDATHECGMYYEHHSCGMIRDLVPELVGLGIDALNPVQLQNDPKHLKDVFGDRLTLSGGFDNQGCIDRPDATEEEIRASLRKTLEVMAPGGKWIARTSFINKGRDQIWLDVLDEYNRPLKEKYGVEAVRHTASGKDLYDLSKRTGSTKKQ